MRRFSTVPFSGTKEQEARLTAWLNEHKAMPGAAMPALQKAQEIYGYLPIEVQRIVADALGKPLAESPAANARRTASSAWTRAAASARAALRP